MGILSPILDPYFECLNIKESVDEIGFPNYMGALLEDVIMKPYLLFAQQMYKVSSFIIKSAEAIAKAIAGNVTDLNELIDEYLIEPLDEFMKLLSKPVDFVKNLIGDALNNFSVPIGGLTFNLFGLDISLPANESFNELTDDSVYNTPAWDDQLYNVIDNLTRGILTAFNYVKNKVANVVTYITNIIGLVINKLEESIAELTKELASYVNPLIDTVDTWLSDLVRFFETNEEKVTLKVNALYAWILDALTGLPDMSKLPDELKIIAKFVYCTMKFLFDCIVYILSFKIFM